MRWIKKKAKPKKSYKDWITKDGLIKLEGYARDGLIDKEIAEKIGIATGTIYEWKKKYPQIAESLKRGKEVIDRQVENTLLKRAMGYEFEEIKETVEIDAGGNQRIKKEKTTKLIVPDVTAIIFWLKNRKPDEWRDRKDLDISGSDIVINMGDSNYGKNNN